MIAKKFVSCNDGYPSSQVAQMIAESATLREYIAEGSSGWKVDFDRAPTEVH